MKPTFIDVSSRAELPASPPGFRYLDFLGGDKEQRCFLVPEAMPRLEFMQKHAELLHPALEPIYHRRGICVRQDASYAVPGFYILGLDRQYSSFDAMDSVLHLRAAFVMREVRRAMRSAVRVQHIHLHYEEKPRPSCNVHYWLLPIWPEASERQDVIMRLDLRRYFQKFRFAEQKERIVEANQAVREELDQQSVATRDDALSALLERCTETEGSEP